MHNAAVILLFHGSRNFSAEAEAAAFTKSIQMFFPHRSVSYGFLRESAPDIRSAILSAVNSGATAVRLLPIFALTGNHTSHDIPNIINEMKAVHPGLSVILDPVLVQTPQFSAFIRSRIDEERA